MSPDELIQLMRTCSMAQVRKVLVFAHKKDKQMFAILQDFYEQASKAKV
jgi:hypothetical protein